MIHVFMSPEEPCEYLKEKQWRHLCFQLPKVSPSSLDELLFLGFRHFGAHFFRVACVGCQACQGLRLPLEEFQISKSQKRVLSKNQDLRIEWTPPQISDEALDLHNYWQTTKHENLGWSQNDYTDEEYKEAFTSIGESSWQLSVYSPTGDLLAVSFVDSAIKAGNSIYSFYHPAYEKRSLGTYTMLREIEFLKSRGVKHHYLGHTNEHCRSLSYKQNFRPFQCSDYGEITRQRLFETLIELPEFQV